MIAAVARQFLLLIALCLAFCAGPARAAFINGQNYVPLASWARANGLKCSRLNRGGEIVATNRTTRLVFNVDSRNAEINGVQVVLSFPVANQKGVALIAQFDLDTAVRPLLFPPRLAEAKIIKTICLDPGHGGRDTGNHTFWHSEKTYTLALASELRDQLKAAGFNVIMTRSKDTYVDLPNRPALANRRSADLFVSLHFNATEAGRNEVSGPEIYCITPVGASSSNAQGEGSNHGSTIANRCEQKSLLLAYQVEKSLVQNLGVEDRGVRRARFAVLCDAAMPAILIEGGYMTHPVEGKKILDSTYRRQMAQAIVGGIVTYQKLTAPPVPPALSVTNRPPAKLATAKKSP
jgi:N-acetylmuramoyl-L-alanine amidase